MKVPEAAEYSRVEDRGCLIKAYIKNVTTYVKTKYGHLSTEDITTKIKAIIVERIKRPVLTQIYHSSPGNAELREIDLLDFYDGYLKECINAPSGTTYLKSNIKEAFIKKMIADDLAERSRVKNLMLDDEAVGNVKAARVKNSIQSRIKISVNAISGGMQSSANCFYDPAGYNSITSTCRHTTMLGYGHVERFLANNYYLPTTDHVINLAIVFIKKCPTVTDLKSVVSKYKLYIPTYQDVADNFITSMKLYTFNIDKTYLYEFFSKLSTHHLVFIYYAFNLNNLFMRNTDVFKNYLKDVFSEVDTTIVDNTIDPVEIYKVPDGDLMTMIVTVNPLVLGNSIFSKLPKENPDGARRLIMIYRVVSEKIAKMQEVFNLFFLRHIDLPSANQQKSLMRKCVALSDTDSIIFTTKDWVRWYCGNIGYDEDAHRINAYVIYILTKSFVHTFGVISANFGIIKEDLRLIAIKNEFYYPCMLRTPMGKHYVGLTAIKEGRRLPKLKPDIKGKNFRGSDLSRPALDFTKEFLLGILDSYMKDLYISGEALIHQVLLFEQKIVDSVRQGDSIYLGSDPINPKSSYKNPEVSVYFQYLFWTEVFEEDYEPIYVPQKCKVIPISDKMLRSAEYLNMLKETNPKLYNKLIAFLDKYPKKAVNRVFIPPQIRIPKELQPLVLLKNIIYRNVFPSYLGLRSLGIGVGFDKKFILLSDMYKLRETDAVMI